MADREMTLDEVLASRMLHHDHVAMKELSTLRDRVKELEVQYDRLLKRDTENLKRGLAWRSQRDKAVRVLKDIRDLKPHALSGSRLDGEMREIANDFLKELEAGDAKPDCG